MKARNGLTRIDLVVAAACVFFVLANVPVIIAAGRGRAKLEVCLANLRALTGAWQMHANDNDGKIVSGDVCYSWSFPPSAGGPQHAWFDWPGISCPNPVPDEEDWKESIAYGGLWKYIRDYNLYQCPSGEKNHYVTYSMAHSMNTYPGSAGPGSVSRTITIINRIIHPSERFVFLDVGSAKQGAFYVSYDGSGSSAPGKWYDPPPMRHNQGTTFVFADGHAIYRKWTDPHVFESVDSPWGQGTIDYCDCDLRWMTKITWGDVPYDCSDPDKNCPD